MQTSELLYARYSKTRIDKKHWALNAIILTVLLSMLLFIYPHASYGLRSLIIIGGVYLVTANIVSLILFYFGVHYTKYKPRVVCIDDRHYIRKPSVCKLNTARYYGYRSWDYIDFRIEWNVFRRAYRVSTSTPRAHTFTSNRFKVWLCNTLLTIGSFYCIFIYRP